MTARLAWGMMTVEKGSRRTPKLQDPFQKAKGPGKSQPGPFSSFSAGEVRPEGSCG
jgi:hypothetical protein